MTKPPNKSQFQKALGDSNTAEPFYKLMSSEVKQLYQLKLLDAPTYILWIIKTSRAPGWKWTFKVKDFCKEWGIPDRTFYRALSKLKELDLLHCDINKSTTVWHGAETTNKEHTDYADFLNSDYWRQVRQAVLARDQHQCQKCGEVKALQVHHLTYKHHRNELNHLEDLMTVCESCHSAIHQAE